MAKQILIIISIILGIIISIIAIISLIASYPKIEISFYKNYNEFRPNENIFVTNPQKINLSIVKNSTINKNPSKLCFRIKNLAEPIVSPLLVASNLRTEISTNALCEECDVFTSHNSLKPQNSIDICKEMVSPDKLNKIEINLSVTYNALLVKNKKSLNFECIKLGEDKDSIQLNCNRK